MASKPLIESSRVLSSKESTALVKELTGRPLSQHRKAVLDSYASAAQQAFRKYKLQG